MKITKQQLKQIIKEELFKIDLFETTKGHPLKTGGVGGKKDIGDPAYGAHSGMLSKTHSGRDYTKSSMEAPDGTTPEDVAAQLKMMDGPITDEVIEKAVAEAGVWDDDIPDFAVEVWEVLKT